MKQERQKLGWPARWGIAAAVVVLAAAGLAVLGSASVRWAAFRGLPRVMLWAWERPEDLRFLAWRQPEAGVAFLAQTVYLGADELVVRPRLALLRVPEGTALVAVARIETGGRAGEEWAEGQMGEAVRAIAELAALREVRAIQVDFDARESERRFYRELLIELRKKTPQEIAISITALASWCAGDPWIESLPRGTIAEAVPMLFEMGPDGPDIVRRAAEGQGWNARSCEGSVGLSTRERLPREVMAAARGQRVYWFHYGAWTAESFESVKQELEGRR